MLQSTFKQRKGSFDLSESMVQSNFIMPKLKKTQEEQIINYSADDDFEMIEKQPLNQPLQILTREQLYQISLGFPFDKQQLAATLLQQRKIPFQTRKAIWMRFVKRGNTQQYFNKEPSILVRQQIEKDVPRSGDGNKMNNSKYTNILYKILCAYAIYNTQIGYTQGMNIICGKIILLLSIDGNDKQLEADDVEVIENEDEIFWMFVHIMKSMENLFHQDVPGIHERIFTLTKMLNSRFPELLVHLSCNQIDDPCICFNQYYFTMLMQKQHKKFARMVLEMFLLFGNAFIQNFIVGTLQFYAYRILRMNDLEKLMPFFREDMFTLYYLELKKQKKENTIASHFQINHYFEEQPYFGEEKKREVEIEPQKPKNQWARIFSINVQQLAKRLKGK